MKKEYGYFTKSGYRITERETPRHWYNYLYNDEYITFVSQVGFGQGFAQDEMGRRIQVVDDRTVYLTEGKDFWQATGLPVQKELELYYCEHGIGYTDIVMQYHGIWSECRYFVPNEGRREYLRVRLKNNSDECRTLKVIPYYATAIDCRYKPQGYETDWAERCVDKNCIIGTGMAAYGSKESTRQYAYLTATEAMSGFDTRQNAFIGPYGNKLLPKAVLENFGCTNSECIAEKICLAVENTVRLEAKEEKLLYYAIGVEGSVTDIPEFLPEQIEEEFQRMQEKYRAICEGVTIETPWSDLNHLFNDWLKYQTNMGSRWARVRHNGIRDLTSDTECLGCFAASLAAERLCRVMSYQYATGYAPRTFLDGAVQDKNFSDNTVWLVFAAYAITKELGDISFLHRQVPFNNGEAGSIYEHVRRSVEFLWQFTGHYGMVKIWGGDWNDCMNKAGIEGKGVSVWLSIAFVRAAKMMVQMAKWLGCQDDEQLFASYAAEMEQRVEQYGWDEDRYIYAISDDKHRIGAKECEEGSMYALPQLWSVLAQLNEIRRVQAMDTLEEELNTDLGLLISKPPYTKSLPYIGTMTAKYPGLHENGGVYLHAAVWKLAVDAILKRNDKIEEGLSKILPGRHEYYETCGEPYAMFNSYLGEQTGYRAGKPGQSWRTASGQWLLYSLVRYVYGLQPELKGLKICPCLPPSWKSCQVTKLFRGCRYQISFEQKDVGACNKIAAMYVNGKEADPGLPVRPMAGEILEIKVILTADQKDGGYE